MRIEQLLPPRPERFSRGTRGVETALDSVCRLPGGKLVSDSGRKMDRHGGCTHEERSGTPNLHEARSETVGPATLIGASLWALCCGPRTQEETHSVVDFFLFFF